MDKIIKSGKDSGLMVDVTKTPDVKMALVGQ